MKKFSGLVFILLGVGLVVWAGFEGWRQITDTLSNNIAVSTNVIPIPTISPTPLWQTEPIVPTAQPTSIGNQEVVRLSTIDPTNTATAIQTPQPSLTLTIELVTITDTPTLVAAEQTEIATASPVPPSPTPETTPITPDKTPPNNLLLRFGVGAPYPDLLKTDAFQELGIGWYLTWRVSETPPGPSNVEFWQMIRLSEDGFQPDRETIQQIARTSPGTTWLIGNEPDVRWQDNVTPSRYAELYHILYSLLKDVDPTAKVAIGGITQPTPIRYQYLEMVLSSYQMRYGQDMPIDIWNIHNFILREERDSWGVDIPPGISVDEGILFELDDHDDIETFKEQTIEFRRWMADRGQRNKPLIISEYGILMPEDYGFPLERVKNFMYASYDFMLNASDAEIGYTADGNRLVQRWAWYSLSDDRYPTGNFINLETGELTNLGVAHQEYISKLP